MATTSTSSISELYRSYKKLTNDFLTWLWCQHRLKAPTETDLKFKSTANILKTSQLLQESKAKVPVSVIGSLRKAIKTRKLVADIYQQFGAGHHGHDAFIDRSDFPELNTGLNTDRQQTRGSPFHTDSSGEG